MRIYPKTFPTFKNEPLKSDIKIVDLDLIGKAVVSKVDVNIGETFFAFRGLIVPEITQWSLEVQKGIYLEDMFVVGLLSHSCEPNLFVDMKKLEVICIKPIKAGDVLTMDYNQTESKLFKGFKCFCGSNKCRKNIL